MCVINWGIWAKSLDGWNWVWIGTYYGQAILSIVIAWMMWTPGLVAISKCCEEEVIPISGKPYRKAIFSACALDYFDWDSHKTAVRLAAKIAVTNPGVRKSGAIYRIVHWESGESRYYRSDVDIRCFLSTRVSCSHSNVNASCPEGRMRGRGRVSLTFYDVGGIFAPWLSSIEQGVLPRNWYQIRGPSMERWHLQ